MKHVFTLFLALTLGSAALSAAEGADFSLRMRAGNQISGDKQDYVDLSLGCGWQFERLNLGLGCQALYGFTGQDLRIGPCVDIALFEHAYFRAGALFTTNYSHVEDTILVEGEQLSMGYVSPYLEVGYKGNLVSTASARLGCYLGFSFFTSPVSVTKDPIFEALFILLGYPMSSLKFSCGLTFST